MNITEILEKIKIKRKSKNISQEDFAFRLGISQAAYTNIENKTSKLTVERLLQISQILDEHPQIFFESPQEDGSSNCKYHCSCHFNNKILEKLVRSKDEQIQLLKSLSQNKNNMSV